MSAIQRYDLETTGDCYYYYESMRKRADGDWVTYDDHAAAVAAERQRIIDEMVTPLMEALRKLRYAGGCRDNCTKSDKYCKTKCRAYRADCEAMAAIDAVSAKLKEAKG